MQRTIIVLASLAMGASLLGSPTAHADSGNPAARASGELAGGSVEAGATLASAGVSVTAATVVAVGGSATAIVTGDPALMDETMDLSGRIAAAPFETGRPLTVDDEIIVPAGPPAVPYDAGTADPSQ